MISLKEVQAEAIENEILIAELWDEPLHQYSKSTGIVVTLYDARLRKVSGPHVPNPLSQLYSRAGAWDESGTATRVEHALAEKVLTSGQPEFTRFDSMLPLQVLPLKINGKPVGAFAVGWMFDHFADPVESDRLAKAFDLSPTELWGSIRQHMPITEQKLNSYCELLSTVSSALVTEFLDRQNEMRTSRVLRILNQSAQALTIATSYDDIAKATIETIKSLGIAKNARVFFGSTLSEDAVDLSLPFELPPTTDQVVPKLSISHRVPVESGDGKTLALIEVEAESKVAPLSADHMKSELAALSSQVAVAIQKVRLISDLQSQKSALQATLSELQRASTTRDEFLATVSHELRSPLNAMLGWVQILRMGSIDESKREVALETIERNARAQSKLIEDLLDVSRIISGKMQLELSNVDLASTISEAIKTVKPATDSKQIQIRLEGAETESSVRGDFLRLQQVFWNLLSNAARHTPAGGLIVVQLARVQDNIEVSITDTGEGISAEFLPRLFDRFSQQDSTSTRSHGGLGLGLAIVRQIVQLHGGTIEASSQGKGLGSKFTVKIPQMTASHQAEALAKPLPLRSESSEKRSLIENVSMPLRGRKILIVDDISDSRFLMKFFIERAGADVLDADSVEAAMLLLSTSVPDLVVSDIAMPVHDGFELISRIRSSSSSRVASVPAIAVTAYTREEDRDRCLRAGFQDHVSKPVDAKSLIAAIAQLVNRPN